MAIKSGSYICSQNKLCVVFQGRCMSEIIGLALDMVSVLVAVVPHRPRWSFCTFNLIVVRRDVVL
jgi:hypothetical protein